MIILCCKTHQDLHDDSKLGVSKFNFVWFIPPLQVHQGTAKTVPLALRACVFPLRSPTPPVKPSRPLTSTKTRQGYSWFYAQFSVCSPGEYCVFISHCFRRLNYLQTAELSHTVQDVSFLFRKSTVFPFSYLKCCKSLNQDSQLSPILVSSHATRLIQDDLATLPPITTMYQSVSIRYQVL